MSAKDRKATQRDRLIEGMLQTAVRDGYAEATISKAIAHAGVSRPTFYDYFADKDDCFLAVNREIVGPVVAHIRRVVEDAPPERAAQTAVRVTVELTHAMPDRARFVASEMMAAGPRALDERDRTIDAIAQIVDEAHERAAPDAPSPDLPSSALIGAVYTLLTPLLRLDEHNLTTLGKELERWIASYERPTGEHRWRTLTPGPQLPPSPHTVELAFGTPAPIPPGRSRLSGAEIARNHRERILFAVAELAVEKGFSATTIADIATLARVDRRVFYAHFRDKQEAFLAAHELAIQQTLAVAGSAFFGAASWPERIWESVRAAAQFQAVHPALMHVGYVESHAVGSPAVQRIEDTHTAFTIFLREGCQLTPDPPSTVAMEAISAIVSEIGYRQCRGGTVPDFPRLTPNVVYLCLAPFLGPRTATEFVERELEESVSSNGARDVARSRR
ncbi:MAG TPA: TetR/AcrR family transcriptional regulator [Solirubrobacteraceae bacterium]|jgi:AcrR family transcriptional regulator|nr:TetR/AcrR family transcriptional regulator [Solirubrobacteraceae bacterium]